MNYYYPVEIPKKESFEIKVPCFRNKKLIPNTIAFESNPINDQIEIKITHGNNTVLNTLSNYFYLNSEIYLLNLVNFFNNDSRLIITIKNNSRDYFRNTLVINHTKLNCDELPIVISQKIQKIDFKTCLKNLVNYSIITEINFIIKQSDLDSSFDASSLSILIKPPFNLDISNNEYNNILKYGTIDKEKKIICFNFNFEHIQDTSIFEHLIIDTNVDLEHDLNINYLVQAL